MPLSRMLLELELHIGVCREQDLAALEWLGLHSGQRGVIAETFASQSRGEGLMLLAMANDFPLAQGWLDFHQRGTRARPRLWAFRVFPPLRGAGIGTWMMAAIEGAAKTRGAEQLEVGVETHNTAARRLYERLGYRLCGSEHAIQPDRAAVIDQYLLAKIL